jgi:hypothetical protein
LGLSGLYRRQPEGEPTGETGTIISIDFENDIAITKIELSDPADPIPYVDYLMRMKLHGGWTIIHKMFTKRRVNNVFINR